MSRKVYVDLKVKLLLNVDEGVEIQEVLSDMEYSFISNSDNADVVDSEIEDWEVTDSK